MAKYSDLIVTNEGLQYLKNIMAINSALSIDRVIALQNKKIKDIPVDQLKNIKTTDYYDEENNSFKERSADFQIIDYHYPNMGENVKNALHFTIELINDELNDDLSVDAILVTVAGNTGEEIFAIAKGEQPEIIPAHKDDDVTYTFTADLFLNIDRADKITVKYSPDGLVRQQTFEEHVKDADERYAEKAETYNKSEVNNMLKEAGKVKTVNNIQPDKNGNVYLGDILTNDKLNKLLDNGIAIGYDDELIDRFPTIVKIRKKTDGIYINGDELADILSSGVLLKHKLALANNVYTKKEVYSREEINSKLVDIENKILNLKRQN